jgi:hypothetical protein
MLLIANTQDLNEKSLLILGRVYPIQRGYKLLRLHSIDGT